jgi:pimeloyl-ACP methyl ester carboxylesterase
MLTKRYKIIAVELQAHGHTSDRDAPETFEQDADDVAALLKQLNISKASILGFSNGASTTLQIAIRHPAIVDKIIVVAGAYRRDGFIPGFLTECSTQRSIICQNR